MRELFVYYRVRSEHLEAARRAARDFGRRLLQELPPIRTRWLHRADATGGPDAAEVSPTWMEHHAVVGSDDQGGVTPELQASIEALAAVLLPFIDGPRHVEVFVRLPFADLPRA